MLNYHHGNITDNPIMGKSTLSTPIFNSFFYVYQAGYPIGNWVMGEPTKPSSPGPSELLIIQVDTQNLCESSKVYERNITTRPGKLWYHGDTSWDLVVIFHRLEW